MADMTINGGHFDVQALLKLRHGTEQRARDEASWNLADDVFLQVGPDTWMASGQGWNLKGVKAGDRVQVGNLDGTVVATQDNINSKEDLAKAAAKIGAMGTVGIGLLVASRGRGPNSLLQAAGGFITSIAGLATLILAATGKTPDYEYMKRYAAEGQPKSPSLGAR